MGNVLEICRLSRAHNCLLAVCGVWVGAYMTWFHPQYYGPIVSSIVVFLLCAAGNIVNDMVDIEIDRFNRPRRVLVREAISKKNALILAVLFSLFALLAALAVNREVLIVGCIAFILLMVYNLWLKRVPVIGNFVIAVLGGATFITGGLAVDPGLTWVLPGPLIPAVYALLFHLVREIVKDVQDIEGDRQNGIVTLPQVIGIKPSLLLALGIFFMLVLLTYIPIFTGWFGKWYKILAVYVVDLPVLALLIFIWDNPSQRMLTVGSLVLKIGMVIGVVALLVA